MIEGPAAMSMQGKLVSILKWILYHPMPQVVSVVPKQENDVFPQQ